MIDLLIYSLIDQIISSIDLFLSYQTDSTDSRWRADDIFDLLRPAASLSLGQELHLAEGTSQSLEQQFGTVFRLICDSTRSHCCHLDKNWNSICL